MMAGDTNSKSIHTDDPANWRTQDLPLGADSLRMTFDAVELAEMDAHVEKARKAGVTAESVADNFFLWPQVKCKMQAVLSELRGGRGAVVLGRCPVERWSREDAALIYWGLGLSMGRGVAQSVKGDRLGHVRDMSALDPSVRAYQNKYELNPHTDHTEIVALFCLRDALSGGATPLASALAIHDAIASTAPELLPILYQGFPYHRRGEELPGEPEITPYRVPIFSFTEGKLSCRFLRPWIEGAAKELGTPLTSEETRALDLIQALALRPEFCLPLRLSPGEMVIFNNFTLLHARTPFVDHDDPERKRHLLRLWLLSDGLRPTAPEMEIFSTRGGIQKREGALNRSFDWGVGGR